MFKLLRRLFKRKHHVLYVPEWMWDEHSFKLLKSQGVLMARYRSTYGRDLPFIIKKNGDTQVIDIFPHTNKHS